MKSIIIRNGLWASVFIIGVAAIPLLFTGIPGPDDYKQGEVIGYSSIVLSMIFVVLGMRQLKIAEGGILSYWKAVKAGILITTFPSIAFGLYNWLYCFVIDPEFLDKYTEYSIASRGAGKTAEELELIKKAVLEEQQMFENPFFQFFIMFLTVFIIGAIISLVAAFFVKSKNAIKEG